MIESIIPPFVSDFNFNFHQHHRNERGSAVTLFSRTKPNHKQGGKLDGEEE